MENIKNIKKEQSENPISQSTALSLAELWPALLLHQNENFYTVKHLLFTYTIKGGEMFVDRRSKSITRSTVEKAYKKLLEDTEGKIRGPKALNCFGAPYIWSVFQGIGIPLKREE